MIRLATTLSHRTTPHALHTASRLFRGRHYSSSVNLSQSRELRPLFERKIRDLEHRFNRALSPEIREQAWQSWLTYGSDCEKVLCAQLVTMRSRGLIETQCLLAQLSAATYLESIKPQLYTDLAIARRSTAETREYLFSSEEPSLVERIAIRALGVVAEEILSRAERLEQRTLTVEERQTCWEFFVHKRLHSVTAIVREKIKESEPWDVKACKEEIRKEYRERTLIALERHTEDIVKGLVFWSQQQE